MFYSKIKKIKKIKFLHGKSCFHHNYIFVSIRYRESYVLMQNGTFKEAMGEKEKCQRLGSSEKKCFNCVFKKKNGILLILKNHSNAQCQL